MKIVPAIHITAKEQSPSFIVTFATLAGRGWERRKIKISLLLFLFYNLRINYLSMIEFSNLSEIFFQILLFLMPTIHIRCDSINSEKITKYSFL